jgi:methylamine---glutamate N-methyltransferase subunit C
MLLGQKVSERVASMRTLPAGIDQRSASRHPDWTGPDDLRIKIEELREATAWEKPIYVKLGATRVTNDVKLAVAAGAMLALGCNKATWRGADADHDATADYAALGTAPGFCHHCHTGACPVGVTTQDPDLSARLDPEVGARWVTNYLKALTMELTALARACGKSNVHHLEPEDLVALTVEAAAMAGVPLAGTNWIPGRQP